MRLILIFAVLFFHSTSYSKDGLARDIINKLGSLKQAVLCSVGNSSCCQQEQNKPDPLDEKTWEEYGYKNIEIGRVSTAEFNQNKNFTHELNISLVALKNAGWKKEQIAYSIANVAKIFAQCGIQLGEVMIASGNSPNDQVTGDQETDRHSFSLASQTPQMKKPMVYLINAAYSDTSFSFIFKDKTVNPLHNTSWVTQQSMSTYKKVFRDPLSYLLAHELTHVLIGKDTHYKGSDKNLMSDEIAKMGETLTPQQCAEMKKNPLLKKL